MNLLRTSAVVMFLSSPALAQGYEQRQGRVELHQEQREARDDKRDAMKASTLLSRYDAARARYDRRTLRLLDGEALGLLDRELNESRMEVRKAHAEVARSSGEVARSREELRHTGHPAARADDRRDLRDDVRDRNDDVRDAVYERRDMTHVRNIRANYAALVGRLDARSTGRKRMLLADFLQRSRAELAADAAERREDHRELREDRREAREDRR
ncbi:MAG: hypothetical protein L0Y66_04940 [Myxococcaceae bacterium]|nr:hypothetical protein [Myxococcaceae bacterium]MCI0670240.1 hypothetical protein [Myxococcaceae bacterium]